MFTETIEHTWEAGHSLPHLPGKCASLHGHTWRASITIAAAHLDTSGILVDFGLLKARAKTWIDTHLDHALMLGADDPLMPLLEPGPDGTPTPLATMFLKRGQRLFVFGRDFTDVAWPSVEGVAQLLAHHAHDWLARSTTRRDVYVSQVTVRETDRNSAAWHNPEPPIALHTIAGQGGVAGDIARLILTNAALAAQPAPGVLATASN
ncbi:6-pyruvoyl trahydropterin synthase family protein [Nonomuraea sp. JJY05]|uniref:6-pyruvoyl trahydropterin synthase family protein n=1 Tax=Nonomuraea sp. JJY05 TaxID=3350255 RepID=UPI00373F62BB